MKSIKIVFKTIVFILIAMNEKTKNKLMMIIIGLLVLTGLGMSSLHYTLNSYNHGFEAFPITTFLHILPGAIYLGLAPFQFIPGIRKKWIEGHRHLGRVLVVIGIIVGITALIMAIAFPFAGKIESISVGFFTAIFLFSIVKGYLEIRKKNTRLHSEWMLRAFALGLAIATSRLLFLPFFFAITDPTLEEIQFLFIMSFIVAFSLHLILAEIWIRRVRKLNACLKSSKK